MTKASNSILAAAVATLTLFAAAPSFAATMINVVESGEGGEAMTLTLDKATVKAGPVTFMVKNDAMTEEHEMVAVRLKSPDQKVTVDPKTDRVDEKKLKSIGEVSELKPGKSGELKANLKPGTYLLLCNIKGHYKAGMFGQLVVTK